MIKRQTFLVTVDCDEGEVLARLHSSLKGHNNNPSQPCTIIALDNEYFKAGGEANSIDNASKITSRQREILSLIARGLSNKHIGRALGISHFTVRNHITCLFRAFGVSGRTALLNAVGKDAHKLGVGPHNAISA
jgi:DNA-binding NarL/FixJ family response regulator